MVHSTEALQALQKVWRAGLVGEKYIKEIWFPNTPLWRNPQLPDLNSIQVPGAWTKFKVKKLSQVVQGETMISFAVMIELWNIWMRGWMRDVPKLKEEIWGFPFQIQSL